MQSTGVLCAIFLTSGKTPWDRVDTVFYARRLARKHRKTLFVIVSVHGRAFARAAEIDELPEAIDEIQSHLAAEGVEKADMQFLVRGGNFQAKILAALPTSRTMVSLRALH